MSTVVVPQVLSASSVDEKNLALCAPTLLEYMEYEGRRENGRRRRVGSLWYQLTN